jgi:hypothetical protein
MISQQLVMQVEDVRIRGGPILLNSSGFGFREVLAHQDTHGSAQQNKEDK